MNFRIVSDLGADIPNSLINSQLTIINQKVWLNGQYQMFDLKKSQSMLDFYKQIRTATDYKTEAMHYEDVYPVIENEAMLGDVLCFSFSQRLSGTGVQIEKACLFLDGKYGKVKYFDTKTATLGQGIIVYHAILCRNEGMDIEQTIVVLNDLLPHLRFFLALDNNNNFIKGGRAGEQLVSNAHIYYPTLYLPIGDLYKKVGNFLSREIQIAFLINYINKYCNNILFIAHGSNIEEVESMTSYLNCNTYCDCFANPVMGIHTGDNAILIAFLEK
jgi:DegV family protein with EDD domain